VPLFQSGNWNQETFFRGLVTQPLLRLKESARDPSVKVIPNAIIQRTNLPFYASRGGRKSSYVFSEGNPVRARKAGGFGGKKRRLTVRKNKSHTLVLGGHE